MAARIVARVLKVLADGAVFGNTSGSWPPAVVALHGWGRTRADFAAMLDGLDALALDLPGFGASPEPPEVWGAREYAGALVPALEEIGQPVVLVGHSRGGCIAVCVAAERPDLVRGLVLTGAPLLRPPGAPGSKPPLGFRVARALHRRKLLSGERMEALRQKHGSADYRAAQGRMRDILVRMVNETYEDELRRLERPVELVWGAADTAAPVAVAERAAQLAGDARVTVLEGIDHHVPLRAAVALRGAIDRMLERTA